MSSSNQNNDAPAAAVSPRPDAPLEELIPPPLNPASQQRQQRQQQQQHRIPLASGATQPESMAQTKETQTDDQFSKPTGHTAPYPLSPGHPPEQQQQLPLASEITRPDHAAATGAQENNQFPAQPVHSAPYPPSPPLGAAAAAAAAGDVGHAQQQQQHTQEPSSPQLPAALQLGHDEPPEQHIQEQSSPQIPAALQIHRNEPPQQDDQEQLSSQLPAALKLQHDEPAQQYIQQEPSHQSPVAPQMQHDELPQQHTQEQPPPQPPAALQLQNDDNPGQVDRQGLSQDPLFTYGPGPYFPPERPQTNPSASVSSDPSGQGDIPPPMPPRPTKAQEHELHKEHESSDAPPPYTLEDEGPYAQNAQPDHDDLYKPAEPPRPQHPVEREEQPPPMPPRPQPSSQIFAPPPSSQAPLHFPDDDPSNPVHYTRDPHRLIGYLVPFPKPKLAGVDSSKIPTRFLIYTPPPPPLQAPAEGVEESRINKLQRKWQNEVRSAKQSDAKLASWKGVKSRATKGISWAMGAVKSAELDFLNRVPAASSRLSRSPSRDSSASADGQAQDLHANDGQEGSDHRTVGLEALDLIYPPSLLAELPGGESALRAEFINSMMRTRSKAQRDAVIATGLLPVSAAIDILATVIWPFGGLLEVDGVWAYASIRGAKTARSVTKRLASSTHQDTYVPDNRQDTRESLALNFHSSSRLEALRRYLANKCVERDSRLFAGAREAVMPPTETTLLSAIGWAPSQSGGETRNWEDEQWETEEVKDDLKMVFGKAAKSWEKWCKGFEKNPEKALKK